MSTHDICLRKQSVLLSMQTLQGRHFQFKNKATEAKRDCQGHLCTVSGTAGL